MGGTRQTLTLSDIVEIDRQAIKEFGGLFLDADDNLVNPGSLEYILEAVWGSMFGVEPYPAIVDKAAAIGWTIMAKHVFHDGNKRTGLLACQIFLELNGYDMQIVLDAPDQDAMTICEGVAKQEIDLSEFTRWVEQRIKKI